MKINKSVSTLSTRRNRRLGLISDSLSEPLDNIIYRNIQTNIKTKDRYIDSMILDPLAGSPN